MIVQKRMILKMGYEEQSEVVQNLIRENKSLKSERDALLKMHYLWLACQNAKFDNADDLYADWHKAIEAYESKYIKECPPHNWDY